MRRIVPAITAIVFGLALVFGGVQVSQATGTAPASVAVDHCEVVPGPDVHCDTRDDCLDDCPDAEIVNCTDDGCCECID